MKTYVQSKTNCKIHIHYCLLLLFVTSFCETLTPETKKQYKSLISGLGLYTVEDKIDILNATNFKNSVYGTNNAWLVEFYNSWCGHCHKFAPTWKALAANLYGWRNVIKLAAIDCAADENNPICRDYEVMGYPTLKFFPADAPTVHQGIEIPKKITETEIRQAIVGILQKEQLEGRGTHWPNIIPYRSNDVYNLWKETESHEGATYVFLIFEDNISSLATEVILDLAGIPGVEIRSVLAENEVLSRLMGVHDFPSLLLIEQSKSEPNHLKPEENTRTGFRQTIKSYLEAQGISVPPEPGVFKPPNTDEKLPDFNELMKAQEEQKNIEKIKKLGDVVFLADLENTLRYTLEHEIPARKEISGHALVALNNYLSVLAKYFPINESGIQFLQKLRDAIFATEREIRGIKFKTLVTTLSGGLESVLSTKESWLGCKGSESHFRGFPCGLWTLFHFMTVSALHDSDHVHFDPMEVLNAMLGYVTYFFGCTECSKHFQEMAERSMKAKVTNANAAVLWLWSAHNEVNKRLEKDLSEDPEFPKIQFPSPERCQKCRDSSNRWEDQNVLNYLTSMYHQDSLNYMGSNTRLYNPISEKEQKSKEEAARLEGGQDIQTKKVNGAFNIFDISLCVLLYIISAVICIAVCLKFILKKRYRKKIYVHDLLGKV